MDRNELAALLEDVARGKLSVDAAELRLRQQPVRELGFANIDTHRAVRTGAGEVVFGAPKTAGQIEAIVRAMHEDGQERVLITRLSPEKAEALDIAGLEYYETAQLGITGGMKQPDGHGRIVVATGGTGDIPVAEEAALTAEFFGSEVQRIYDVGVAGIHRLLAHMDEIMQAEVVIAAAGMEGALASVIAGLADCPVIALPTSVGYGASFGGVSALLSMLNSCASGVSVVNIDNGFGAGYQASMINHIRIGGKE